MGDAFNREVASAIIMTGSSIATPFSFRHISARVSTSQLRGEVMHPDAIKEMIHNFFRSLHYARQTGGASAEDAVVADFERRIEEAAAQMQPDQAAVFTQAVDTETRRQMAAFKADPEGFQRSLGLEPLSAVGAPSPSHTGQRAIGLVGVAARTAVRATVWELIWSIFRGSR